MSPMILYESKKTLANCPAKEYCVTQKAGRAAKQGQPV